MKWVAVGCAVFLSGLLWLVNDEFRLPAGYVPGELVTVGSQRLHPEAAQAFEAMLRDMEDAGVGRVDLFSAYRPYGRQAQLFANKVRQFEGQGYARDEAEAMASQVVQPAGASEHQTGLALDVSSTGGLSQAFGDTRAGRWLADNAHGYGFVIRYPASKCHTTHIVYEPWHLRYVGVPHAQLLFGRDLTLEEYGDFLAAHSPYTFHADLDEVYVITVLDAPLAELPGDVIDFSALHYGENTRFVLTQRKNIFTIE